MTGPASSDLLGRLAATPKPTRSNASLPQAGDFPDEPVERPNATAAHEPTRGNAPPPQDRPPPADLLEALDDPTCPKPGRAKRPEEDRAPSPVSAEGHRARLRARLLSAGPDAVADHELLEMMLFLALPRRDTKPIARALLQRFGSFASAISAPIADLRTVEGLGDAGVAALKTIQAAALRLSRAEFAGKPVLGDWSRLMDYLGAALSRERIEQFRILFLDSRNRLLADEAQSRGTVNHTPVYPREVVKRALELHATAIILVHNHPSGDPAPSRDDIQMTNAIAQAAQVLGVLLHDHVIIGNGRWFSFRQENLLG